MMKNVQRDFEKLAALCSQVDLETNKIFGRLFFDKVSLSVRFKDPELCFFTLISWMYVLLHESSSRNLYFINKKIVAYQVSLSDEGNQIMKIVHAFRTILQHNTNESLSDKEKREYCELYFYGVINRAWPQSDEDWKESAKSIIKGCSELLAAVKDCLIRMGESANLDLVADEWQKLINRSYTIYEFEVILIKIMKNFGFGGIFDTNKITKREIDKWRKELDVLRDDFNFEVEATRIIERFVLKKELLPITGDDLLTLGFPQGKEMVTAMDKAKDIFYKTPCSKEELLRKLHHL